LSRIITSDESHIHHCDTLTKRQSMNSRRHAEKKFKIHPAACNIMVSVFGEDEGNLSVEFFERGATFNFERNVQSRH
jgi:hypothetical protein